MPDTIEQVRDDLEAVLSANKWVTKLDDLSEVLLARIKAVVPEQTVNAGLQAVRGWLKA